MVHNCIVTGCLYRKRKNIKGGVMFHSFPIDPSRLEAWQEMIEQRCGAKVNITRHSKICQFHFMPDDYQTPLEPTINSASRRNRHLKCSAIPSVFGEDALTAAENWSQRIDEMVATSAPTTNGDQAASHPPPIKLETSESDETSIPRLLSLVSATTATTATIKHPDPPNSSSLRKRLNVECIVSALLKKRETNAEILALQCGNVREDEPSGGLTTTTNMCPPELPCPIFCPTELIHTKNEMELFHFLDRYCLTRYFPNFLQAGADDLRQLCELSLAQLHEIIRRLGMEDKDLHVMRFSCMIDEYRKSKLKEDSPMLVPNAAAAAESTGSKPQMPPPSPVALASSSDATAATTTTTTTTTVQQPKPRNPLLWEEREKRLQEIETELSSTEDDIRKLELLSEQAKIRKLIRKREIRMRFKQRMAERSSSVKVEPSCCEESISSAPCDNNQQQQQSIQKFNIDSLVGNERNVPNDTEETSVKIENGNDKPDL